MKLPFCLTFFLRRPQSLFFVMLLSVAFVASSQQYADYDDYQDYGAGGGDYYGADGGDGYYAQEEDTLYHDYAKHQQEKAMGGGG